MTDLQIPIFDGHNDILDKIFQTEQPTDPSPFLDGGPGHLDLPRAFKSGFQGGMFAVYPPNPPHIPPAKERIVLTDEGYHVPFPPPLVYDYANQAARTMIKLFHNIARESGGGFQIVRSSPDLQAAFQDPQKIAAVLHLEGAEPLLPSLENLDWFLDQGVRSIGLTWSRENDFGHGVPFKTPSGPDTGPGLKPAGKELVRRLDQAGIVIDLAHLNEAGFWDTAELSSAPLVSSHSAANKLIHRSRNLTDDQLRAIRDSNGLAGIIFSVNDLDGGKRPKEDAPLSAVVRHISYIAELIGVDHVAFGSDLDGTVIPSEFGDVGGFPKLLNALDRAGFSQPEIEKISHQNWLRVLQATWKD